MKRFNKFTHLTSTLLLIFLFLFSSCSQDTEKNRISGSNEIFVKTDISLKPTLLELADNYNYLTSVRINFEFCPSFEILSGSSSDSVDVYIFPNDHFVALARETGQADTCKPITLAYTVPSLIVSRISRSMISSLSDIADSQLRVGITDPSTDVAGPFAIEILKDNNLYERLGHRLVTAASTAPELTDRVARSDLDVAICWTMAVNWKPESFDVVLLMPNEIPRVAVISAVKAAMPVDSAAADRFITYLKSDRCQNIFRNWGYLVSQSDIDQYAPAAIIGGEPTM